MYTLSLKICSSFYSCRIYILISSIFLLFCTSATFAQYPISKTSNDQQTSNWKIGVGYLSNYVYNGRQDSLPTPYLTPTIGYYSESGFYIVGSVSFLMERNNRRLDYTFIDIGYSFEPSERFGGEVYANKGWFNESSTNITSDITGFVGGFLRYDLNLVQLTGGMDVLFANRPDLTCNLGISHVFEFGNGDNQVSLEPTFTTNWSTLNSYEGYINRRVRKRPGVGFPFNSTISAATKVKNNRLTLMDFELSLPVTFETARLGIAFTPTLAIPRNPIYTTTTITVTAPGGMQSIQTFPSTPTSELNLKHVFFAELSFFVKL